MSKSANEHLFQDEQLFQAAIRGDLQLVKEALAAGAEVNAKDNCGKTPLHKAAFWGHKETVKFLIKKGAGVNAQNNEKNTPLDLAKKEGHQAVVEILEWHATHSPGSNVKGKNFTEVGLFYSKAR